MSNPMTDNVILLGPLSARYALVRRAIGRAQLSTAISLTVLFALGVIMVSIGIAQADTLSAMVEDETGRLALFGMVVAVTGTGGVVGTMMWLTAPKPARRCDIHRLGSAASQQTGNPGLLFDIALWPGTACLPRPPSFSPRATR